MHRARSSSFASNARRRSRRKVGHRARLRTSAAGFTHARVDRSTRSPDLECGASAHDHLRRRARRCSRSDRHRERVPTHRPQRSGHSAAGQRTRAGPAHLSRPRPGLALLAWGAQDAVPPTVTRSQVKFRLDYSGGRGTYRRDTWKTFQNACRPYTGPALAWFVAGCTARDGSYWALQAWQRGLPDYGLVPTAQQAAWELRLSHWSTPLPVITIGFDWAYRRYDHLFGSLTYGGLPVFGFHSTSTGVTLDRFGRNIYVDTLDSAYGAGWRRENSFLTHRGRGNILLRLLPARHPTARDRDALSRDCDRPRRDALTSHGKPLLPACTTAISIGSSSARSRLSSAPTRSAALSERIS